MNGRKRQPNRAVWTVVQFLPSVKLGGGGGGAQGHSRELYRIFLLIFFVCY